MAQNYNLTVAVSPTGGGTTAPAAGGPYSYGANAVVPITATPNTGYVFDHWTGGVANATSAATTVTMNTDKTVTATFTEHVPGTIALDGSVSSNTADDVNSISFPHTTGTGTNRLTLVGVSWNSDATATSISSVTFTPSVAAAR